jgi:hypothetical protein
MLIAGETTGGLTGNRTSCKVCLPGGSAKVVSVCPPPKCMCRESRGIGIPASLVENVVSINRW